MKFGVKTSGCGMFSKKKKNKQKKRRTHNPSFTLIKCYNYQIMFSRNEKIDMTCIRPTENVHVSSLVHFFSVANAVALKTKQNNNFKSILLNLKSE